MAKADGKSNTSPHREQMKSMARYWQRRAAEAKREGRLAEASTFMWLATVYRRPARRA